MDNKNEKIQVHPLSVEDMPSHTFSPRTGKLENVSCSAGTIILCLSAVEIPVQLFEKLGSCATGVRDQFFSQLTQEVALDTPFLVYLNVGHSNTEWLETKWIKKKNRNRGFLIHCVDFHEENRP